MLFDNSIEDHEILEEWVKDIGIKYHEGLIIKKTKDRGIGVFFKSNKIKDPIDPTDNLNKKLELIRCPKKSVFNMYTLREIVNNMDDKVKDIIKKVIKIVFSNCGPTESNIIIAYFISFSICLRKGIKINFGIKEYFKILIETKVGSPYTDQRDILEDFIKDFKGNILMNSLVNELNIWENINEELKEIGFEIEFNEILQLCTAIRSRILEIPRYEEDIDDDYYVDITLVPIIDFVNHDVNKFNAFFDIEKETNDIILYYEKGDDDEEEEEEEEEILIKYDNIEDLHKMFTNYGFLPNDNKISKIIELPILGYFNESLINNFQISRKLLISGQSPNLQFLIKFNKNGDLIKCKIIDYENYSIIAFIEDDEINWDEWENEDEKENESENENEDYARKFERSRLALAGIEYSYLEQARVKFKEYVGKFMVSFWKRAELGIELSLEYERPNGESINIIKLLEIYSKIGKFIELNGIEFVNEVEGKFEGLDIENVLQHRLRPIYNWEVSGDSISGGDISGGDIGGGGDSEEVRLESLHL